MNPLARTALLLSFAVKALAQAQEPLPPPQDPFTGAQQKAMQALGVVAYAPLRWADDLSTADVDRVLGESRILWLETEHFRIGSTLKAIDVPEDAVARKDALAECARLGKKFGKMPKRPKKFDAWYRLHLYAQRAEDLYADFAQMVGSPNGATAAGPFLGLPDKYLILLFEKKSDLARYADRFCGRAITGSMRHLHEKSRQELVIATAESDPPLDEAALHSQVNYLLGSALVDGLDGRTSSTPEWLRLGIAYGYSRQVTTNLVTVTMHEDERIDPQSQHLWREKMYARAQHEQLLVPFEQLTSASDFGFYSSIQAWSRVDYLRQLDVHKLGALLIACKKNLTTARQQQALEELFGFAGATFDGKWREWVLKTYK